MIFNRVSLQGLMLTVTKLVAQVEVKTAMKKMSIPCTLLEEWCSWVDSLDTQITNM